MAGRSPNRCGGRGGRGGRGRGSGTSINRKKKTIEDYFFYVGSSKQASDYEITAEFVINHIKMTFDRGNDIAESLKEESSCDTDAWKPALKTSNKSNADEKARENKQFELEYKAELDEAMKRKRTYQDNEYKAYALIWQRCAKAMQNRLLQRKDYQSTIYNNPIQLLKAIKEHALNYQETRYEMSIVSDAFRATFNTRQRENESLQDYTRRFKTSKEILESHVGGPVTISKFIKSMQGYDPNDVDIVEEMTKKAHEQLFSYVYLENADPKKYGSIMKNLNSQKSLGNDQYPKTLIEATNVLSNHRFDSGSSRRSNNKDNNKEREEGDTKDETLPLSFHQLEGKCYCCGKQGHKSPSCRQRDRPKDEWAINKIKDQLHAQAGSEKKATNDNQPTATTAEESSAASESTSTKAVGWAGAHIQMLNTQDMKKLILLDNQSTTSVFCNSDYVNDIRGADHQMELHTNGGPMISETKCNVKRFGESWFNPNSMTNIFSMAEMTDKYRVTFDSDVEDAFIVHLPEKQIKFPRISNGLYAMNPNERVTDLTTNYQVQHLTTLEENKKFFTPREFERAKKARDLYHALGTPSTTDLKAMIRMNLIRNNQVTNADIDLAEKIFGPDVATIKGKATRRKPIPVVEDLIDIPDELISVQEDVTLAMDGLTVNSLKFLSTISLNLYYRTAHHMPNTTAKDYETPVEEVIGVYRQGGFTVNKIKCDNEFCPVMDSLAANQRPPITMNYSNPKEHVPEAERNNRVIKERVRATYHRLPYVHLPRALVKALVMEAARKLNMFPNKHGVSKYYSPRMILHHQNIDYDRHCKFSTGMYVEGHDEPDPSNTNAPRSLDCIYLRPTNSAQGGHDLLHLATNKQITRRKVTACPITPSIIRQVHAIAEMEGMPKGLKIYNRTNQLLFDSAWIAGVDYDAEEFDDDDYQDDEEESVDEDDDEEEEEYEDLDPNEIADLIDERQQMGTQEQPTEEEREVEAQPEPDQPNPSEDEGETVTRSGRVSRPPDIFVSYHQQLNMENATVEEYNAEYAQVIAKTMCHYNDKFSKMDDNEVYNFIQTYSLNKGIKKFGESGKQAVNKELKQVHDRVVFEPIHVKDLTPLERKRAMESLLFLVEKRDGRIKARMCANGSTQREYIPREDASSPTAATESVLITGVIEAKQHRDVMTNDIPNAFVQTPVDTTGEKIIMKIQGKLVDHLLQIAPEVYEPYVVYEGKNGTEKVLYVRMLMALYGMLIASLLYYKKFIKDLKSIGFEVNPYDVCVANRKIKDHQHTVLWHVDDLKSSHVDPSVNDEFHKWLEATYGNDEIGHVTATRGKVHDYLGMTLDYSTPGVLKVDMRDYIRSMEEDFPDDLSGNPKTPWTEKLFKVDKTSNKLSEHRRQIFHSFVMKGMFLCKRARSDVLPAFAFLATRVQDANENDWNKLVRVLNFLKCTIDDVLELEADDTQTLTWHVDSAFAVHPDMKSHTGSTFTLGKGAISPDSTKQKVNTRSSTESELVAVDDRISKILWCKRFIEKQGYKVKLNILYQDNTSAIKLEENAKGSSGKRTRHFDIKYFYVTDLISRDEIVIKYCPTDDMVADYMTKPLVGAPFVRFRKWIMNLKP